MKNKKYEFSNKKYKKQIYDIAIDDWEDLIYILKFQKYDFNELKNTVELRPCGKCEYDFEWNSLTITIERDNNTYKFKTIRVYDLKTCDFFCYMKIKGAIK